MPLFQFYFPLPFILMVALGNLIPLEVAFKLVTVLGVFTLPFTTYFCMRLMGFRFPMPVFAATFTLPFLFQESHSMWGGNIPSTLAGEFSYSISLSLTVLFFGTLYRGLIDKKHILRNALLLAAVAFTHVITLLWAVSSSTFFIASNKKGAFQRMFHMGKLYVLAFMLTGFWTIPLISRIGYTTPYDITWNISEDVLPPILWPFLLLSCVGFFVGVSRGEYRMLFFTYATVVSSVYFIIAQPLGLVDIRFIPFIYLTLMFFAAYGLAEALRSNKAVKLFPFLVLGLTLFWVDANKTIVTGISVTGIDLERGRLMNRENPIEFHLDQVWPQLMNWKYGGYTAFWVQWNYEGYEAKPLWKQFRAVNDFLRGGYSDPRAQFEHNDKHDSAGSVRAFENIPLFSGRSILEGLYMSSIETSPFMFYIQSEISEQQSCPFYAVYQCTEFNLENGTKHLKMFNVRYIVARSRTLKDAFRENSEWRLAFSDDPYEVWELTTNPDHYVTVPANQPILLRTGDWKGISYEWFKRLDLVDVPLVFKDSVDSTDIGRFNTFFDAPSVATLDSLPMKPLNLDCKIDEKLGQDTIEFTTDCVGRPHIISVSYYPGWKVDGADRIYLVSPSFMLVYPNQNRVRLVYGKTFEDWAGMLLSLSGAGILAYASVSKDRRARRFFAA